MSLLRDVAAGALGLAADRVAAIARAPSPGTSVTMIGPRATAATRGTAELVNTYRTSPWLRGVISKVAWSVAAIPWRLYVVRRKSKNGKRLAVRTVIGRAASFEMRKKLLNEAEAAGELDEITEHPLLDMLASANPVMTGLASIRLTQTYLELKGESFWRILPNQFGTPGEIWPMPPHWVTRVPTPKKPGFEVTLDGRTLAVPEAEILWFRDINPSDPYGRGIGLGESLGDEIETDEYAAKFLKTFFLNRAHPDLLVSIDGASQDALKEAKARFENQHQGMWRGLRSFWHSGKMSVHELQQRLSDMGLVDLRGAQRDIVQQVIGVPPEIMGNVTSSNRATAHEARRIYASEVIIPRMEFLRSEMQERLLPLYDQDNRLILDYPSPMPEDREQQLEAMRAAPYAPTRGEWRRRQGLPDRGDIDDVHLVPLMLDQQAPDAQPESDQLVPPPAPPAPSGEAALREVRPQGRSQRSKVQLRKDFAEDDVDNVLEALRPERLTGEVRDLWDEELTDWAARELEDLGLDPAGFDMLNPRMLEHLENFAGDRITDINATTRELVRETLLEGVRAGEGTEDLARRLKGTLDDPSRRRSIARTEANRSANFGTTEAHTMSGIVKRRRWVSTPDDRTRDAHIELDGQEVDIDEPFEVDGKEAMHPGGFNVAELDVMCRCTTIAVLEEKSSDETAAQRWKVFDRHLRAWDRAAERAFRRGFAAQLKDAMKVLAAA